MTAYRHFTGEYRAWFRTRSPQWAHTHSFQKLVPEALEIRNLRTLASRQTDTERAGDYLYFPIVRTRKKSAIARMFQSGATDVVIVGDGSEAYSEDLEEVVLRSHSGERTAAGSQIRESRFRRIGPDFVMLEGQVTFSVPYEPLKAEQERQSEEPVAETPVIAAEPQPEPRRGITDIPDLVLNRIPTPARTLPRMAGGCLLTLWSIGKWIFYMLLFLAFLGWAADMLHRGGAGQTDTGEGRTESGKPRLNPKQDTLAPMPWDYLTDHTIRWDDFVPNSYTAAYSTSSKEFEDSQRLHPPFANPQVSEAMQYWNAVYTEFSRHDMPKLDSIVLYFRNEQRSRNLSSVQTAEMVTTFIQEIPYCLIHEGSCREADQMAAFISDYHRSGKPCLPDIIAGVQSPYEFLHTLKGDCDTRSLLGFSILTRLGIPASVWVSEAYGHSVLGVGLGTGGSNAKTVGGIRHSAVELTAKGFRLGMISPEQGDMNNWEIALFKN